MDWAPCVKASAQSAAVLKADKIALTTQKSIEDCYRPYWDLVRALLAKQEAAEPPTEAEMDVLFLLGKMLANASVFHEQSRVRSTLAILKPGAE